MAASICSSRSRSSCLKLCRILLACSVSCTALRALARISSSCTQEQSAARFCTSALALLLLQAMLHMPQPKAEHLYCITYDNHSTLQRELRACRAFLIVPDSIFESPCEILEPKPVKHASASCYGATLARPSNHIYDPACDLEALRLRLQHRHGSAWLEAARPSLQQYPLPAACVSDCKKAWHTWLDRR